MFKGEAKPFENLLSLFFTAFTDKIVRAGVVFILIRFKTFDYFHSIGITYYLCLELKKTYVMNLLIFLVIQYLIIQRYDMGSQCNDIINLFSIFIGIYESKPDKNVTVIVKAQPKQELRLSIIQLGTVSTPN